VGSTIRRKASAWTTPLGRFRGRTPSKQGTISPSFPTRIRGILRFSFPARGARRGNVFPQRGTRAGPAGILSAGRAGKQNSPTDVLRWAVVRRFVISEMAASEIKKAPGASRWSRPASVGPLLGADPRGSPVRHRQRKRRPDVGRPGDAHLCRPGERRRRTSADPLRRSGATPCAAWGGGRTTAPVARMDAETAVEIRRALGDLSRRHGGSRSACGLPAVVVGKGRGAPAPSGPTGAGGRGDAPVVGFRHPVRPPHAGPRTSTTTWRSTPWRGGLLKEFLPLQAAGAVGGGGRRRG
jgi:hypothetical protein